MILFPSIPFVWPFLLLGAAILLFWFNLKAGIIFFLQILSFQFIKYWDFPHEQVLFIVTLALFACAAYMYSGTSAAITLAILTLLYGAFFLELIGQSAKVISADIIAIVGMICCGYFGNDGGLLAGNLNSHSSVRSDYSSVHMEVAQKEKEG